VLESRARLYMLQVLKDFLPLYLLFGQEAEMPGQEADMNSWHGAGDGTVT
jgi:hypothetical protein